MGYLSALTPSFLSLVASVRRLCYRGPQPVHPPGRVRRRGDRPPRLPGDLLRRQRKVRTWRVSKRVEAVGDILYYYLLNQDGSFSNFRDDAKLKHQR